MDVRFSKPFLKHYQTRIKPHPKLAAKFEYKLELFLASRGDKTLRDHALSSRLAGRRAFSIGGDLRVIYKIEKGFYLFIDVGTHNQVY